MGLLGHSFLDNTLSKNFKDLSSESSSILWTIFILLFGDEILKFELYDEWPFSLSVSHEI